MPSESDASAFLTEIARPRHAGLDRNAIVAAGRTLGDWDETVRQARAHGLTPQLARALRNLPELEVPTAVREAALEAAARIAHTNLASLATIGRIATAFELDRISWCLYKGPALALWLYGDVGSRHYADLDLLVPPAHATAAAGLLREIGYAAGGSPIALDARSLPAEGQIFLAGSAGQIPIELHWDIVQRHFRVGADVEAMLARTTAVRAGELLIPTLAPEDHLLVLCVHHAKHRWERLQWISEVGEIVGRSDELGVDVAAVLQSARRAGAARMVLLALDLVWAIWGISVPAALLDEARRDREVLRLRDEVLARLAIGRGHLSPVAERIPFQSAARERRRDRLRLRIARIFSPSLEDRRVFHLPTGLRALYVILRPLRLIASRVRRLGRKGNP